jgi:hypothetical protein
MQELTIKTLGWKHERLRDGGGFEAGGEGKLETNRNL